ncbi:hypothetical protein [Streptomyces sp. NPDC017991]|uniref:hypothetical protein n=1 Tax=Streptomyces sp. NPDC017991 TaxID=3365026 RepID=UPI0037A44342
MAHTLILNVRRPRHSGRDGYTTHPPRDRTGLHRSAGETHRPRHGGPGTLGLVLAVLVAAATVQDTTGGKLLLEDTAAAHPSA